MFIQEINNIMAGYMPPASTQIETHSVVFSTSDENGNYHNDNGPSYVEYDFVENHPIRICYHKHGLPHRIGGPAVMDFQRSDMSNFRRFVFLNGSEISGVRGDSEIVWFLQREGWYVNGILHRDDGPADVRYDLKRHLPYKSLEEWYKNGLLHRTDGPARIRYAAWIHVSLQGPKRSLRVVTYPHEQIYYFEGDIHREGAPARFKVSSNNNRAFVEREYYRYGELHRDDGPAVIEYAHGQDSDLLFSWYCNGHLHNIDSFAQIYKAFNGSRLCNVRRLCYIDGIQYSKANWDVERVRRRTNFNLNDTADFSAAL